MLTCHLVDCRQKLFLQQSLVLWLVYEITCMNSPCSIISSNSLWLITFFTDIYDFGCCILSVAGCKSCSHFLCYIHSIRQIYRIIISFTWDRTSTEFLISVLHQQKLSQHHFMAFYILSYFLILSFCKKIDFVVKNPLYLENSDTVTFINSFYLSLFDRLISLEASL